MGQWIQRRRRKSYKVLWIISLFSAVPTVDTWRSNVTCDFLRIIRCLFKALTGFHGCSYLHPVLRSIRNKGLEWEVWRCWRLQIILNYTIHILSVCLYPHLFSMQSERVLLYCHLWPARIYHFFPHYLTKATIFEKRIVNIKCVLIFRTNLVWNIFLFIRRIQRAIIYMYIYI